METKNIANALTALISQSLIVLGMDFLSLAELVGNGADTKSVGEAFDALVADGTITADMIAQGEAMQLAVEESQEGMREVAAERAYNEAERLAHCAFLGWACVR